MISEQFDAVIVGAGFGGSVLPSSSSGWASRTSSSSIARKTWAERGSSTTTPGWPSTFRRPPTPTSSNRTPTGRGCSPRVRRSSSTPTTWQTSTTSARTCGSTPPSTALAGTKRPKLWRVALAGGETLTTRYLITATGFLSQPKTPDIPGITSFEGKVIHTTAWDDQYPLKGRRVAVIGTGATAVQLDPGTRQEGRRTSPSISAPRSGWCPRWTCTSADAQSDCSPEFR